MPESGETPSDVGHTLCSELVKPRAALFREAVHQLCEDIAAMRISWTLKAKDLARTPRVWGSAEQRSLRNLEGFNVTAMATRDERKCGALLTCVVVKHAPVRNGKVAELLGIELVQLALRF